MYRLKCRKINTFHDFIDATDYLVETGYAAGDKIFATGTSAGGLIMGYIANEAPARYRGIVARMPFVDLVTTMADATIPMTVGEYGEWGDPRQRRAYEYLLSYSPYDQVRTQAYPNMLITAGLNDRRVPYYEALKWLARLRHHIGAITAS